MSEETKTGYAEAKEALDTAKDTLQESKVALRKFKKAHKVRKAEQLDTDELKAEFKTLEDAVTAADKAKATAEESVKELKPAKGAGGGGKKYEYGKIIDAESGEERETTKEEQKRWRTKARKIAASDDNEFTGPEQVPFDPDFFKPKVKKEKKEKESKKEEAPAKDAKEASKEEAPKKTSRRKK